MKSIRRFSKMIIRKITNLLFSCSIQIGRNLREIVRRNVNGKLRTIYWKWNYFFPWILCRSIYLWERSGKARVVVPVGWNTGVKSEKRVAAKGGGQRSFCPLASHPTSFSLARCPVKSVTLWLPPVNEGTLSISLSLLRGSAPSHLSHTPSLSASTRDPKNSM